MRAATDGLRLFQMHLLPILQAMVLLTLANGTPVVAKRIFGQSFAPPLDAGLAFFDGRPLFGPSKTIRGILFAVLVTTRFLDALRCFCCQSLPRHSQKSIRCFSCARPWIPVS